jgi:hypothetical protein
MRRSGHGAIPELRPGADQDDRGVLRPAIAARDLLTRAELPDRQRDRSRASCDALQERRDQCAGLGIVRVPIFAFLEADSESGFRIPEKDIPTRLCRNAEKQWYDGRPDPFFLTFFFRARRVALAGCALPSQRAPGRIWPRQLRLRLSACLLFPAASRQVDPTVLPRKETGDL